MEEDNSKDKGDAVMVTRKSTGLPGLLTCRVLKLMNIIMFCVYIFSFLVYSSSVYQLFENKSFQIERKDKREILLKITVTLWALPCTCLSRNVMLFSYMWDLPIQLKRDAE